MPQVRISCLANRTLVVTCCVIQFTSKLDGWYLSTGSLFGVLILILGKPGIFCTHAHLEMILEYKRRYDSR